MLGDTLTITHNSVARVLSKINNDNFATRYLLRTGTEEFLVNVRHSTESAKAGVLPFERHNIELTHTVFATPTTVEQKRVASITIRGRRGDDPAAIALVAKALMGWATDANQVKLIAWES